MIKPLFLAILFCNIGLAPALADESAYPTEALIDAGARTVENSTLKNSTLKNSTVENSTAEKSPTETNLVEANLREPKVADNTAARELKKRLAAITSISADFRQQLYSADDYLIQDSQGRMQVSAPGKISWVIDAPMEQWLISDGTTLWLYDPDLEQVIIKPFDQDIAAAPALLLSGSVSELSEVFDVSEVVAAENSAAQSPTTSIRRFKLSPRDNQTLYEYLTFDFEAFKPVAIVIADSLDQRTLITFSNVLINETVDPSVYSFTPPPGTDVIRSE